MISPKFCFINPYRVIRDGNVWGTINSVTPPLGLAILAAVLEDAGIEATIVDANALRLSPEATAAQVPPGTTHVGITASTPEIGAALAVARLVKSGNPMIQVILGGVHPSVLHEELAALDVVDIVVRGEGENSIRELAVGMPLAEVGGITWKRDGEVVVNGERDDFVNLDALPFPAYHKLPMKLYRSALGAAKRNPSIGMITSRGCPGSCSFCYSGMFGAKTRFMSAVRLADHIQMLQDIYRIREVSFYDDTFTASRKRVEEFCDVLRQRKIKLSWSCFARVDTVAPELLQKMKKAGCHQIGYGFESPDETILKNINKKITVDKVVEAVRWTRQAGIDVRGAFMFGNIGETAESLQKTLDYSLQLGIQFAVYNITTPFPGTALHRQAQNDGILLHSDWDRYDLGTPILDLPTVPTEEVRGCYEKAYRAFYFRPSYLLGRILSIRTLDDILAYGKAFVGLVGRG